jgi:hypothetical protein
MAKKERHRGQHPNDIKIFGQKNIPKLKEAVHDLSELLTKGYPMNASLKLVGDHFKLTKRQRLAVSRNVCSEQDLLIRSNKEYLESEMNNQVLGIDGFNLLITIESALSGGFIFIGKDGCYRDMSSIHGSYKRVMETQKAIDLVGNTLQKIGLEKVVWYLDKPVSNSGRLKSFLLENAEISNWNWEVELAYNPDNELIESNELVVSSDSLVINKSKGWFNLAGEIVQKNIPEANIIDLKS